MVLYGVSFLLFILLNIMVRNSPVCSRKKKKRSRRANESYGRTIGILVFQCTGHRLIFQCNCSELLFGLKKPPRRSKTPLDRGRLGCLSPMAVGKCVRCKQYNVLGGLPFGVPPPQPPMIVISPSLRYGL